MSLEKKINEKIENQLDRLAEDIHDHFVGELKRSGIAKEVSPIIWDWYEKGLKKEVLEGLGEVADKIREIFDNSYAVSPEVTEALHKLCDKVLGLLVEPSKEKPK